MVFPCAAQGTGDPLNHSKFAESPEVVRIIGRELAQGQTLTDSRVGVGVGDRIIQVTAGAAAAVGTAAGLAVSAAVAVIDPRTRENLQGHVENLGETSRGTPSLESCLALAVAVSRGPVFDVGAVQVFHRAISGETPMPSEPAA